MRGRPGFLYQVMNRGLEGRELFGEHSDRAQFEQLLEQAVERYSLELLGYETLTRPHHPVNVVTNATTP